MPRETPDPASKDGQTDAAPLIRCRRCDNAFVCSEPELSGAVECPNCCEVAFLSADDAERVRKAAAKQLRDGSFNRRFEEQRSLHKRSLALLPETRVEYAKRADRLRRGAIETCPQCLYDLTGVLEHEQPIPCPECGEETSRLINTLVWGERANECGINRIIARFSGLFVGGLYWIALFGATVTDGMSGLFEVLLFLIIAGIFGLPIGVSFAAYRWFKLRDPTMSEVMAHLMAVLAGIANTAVAIMLAYAANAVMPYF